MDDQTGRDIRSPVNAGSKSGIRGDVSVCLSSGKRTGRRKIAVFLMVLSVLLFPLALEPSPTGEDTHLQMGLPPCSLKALTGIPCALCGATTSYAEMARFHILRALRANVFGTVSYIFLVVLAASLLYEIFGCESRLLFYLAWHFDSFIKSALCLLLFSWIIKLLTRFVFTQ